MILSKLLEYRKVAKSLSTYAEGYEALMHPKTGRLHPHLNQCGAVTGRFGCDKPTLQNVPRDPRIKGCFGSRSLEGLICTVPLEALPEE